MGNSAPHEDTSSFPVAAGVLLGVGLGGFFDGIVFHQILQWHHLLSRRGLPIGQRAEPASQHTMGRPVPCFHIPVHPPGPRDPLAYGTPNPFALVRSYVGGHAPGGLGTVQHHRGDSRPPPTRHPSRQRDGVARAVDLVGRWLSDLGRRHAERRLGAVTARATSEGIVKSCPPGGRDPRRGQLRQMPPTNTSISFSGSPVGFSLLACRLPALGVRDGSAFRRR